MSNKEVTILVTGCLGFIGSHFTEHCIKIGWNVIGIDSCTYAADQSMIDVFKQNKNFLFLKQKIEDLKKIPSCDFIANFAAESHVENSIGDSDCFIKSNIEGTQNLLKLINQKPKNSNFRPKLIHISTDEVYGDIDDGEFFENDILNPSNPYSASKASADMLVMAWSRTHGVKYNIIRPTNNYGMRQHYEKLIPLCVRNLKRGKKIFAHNNGEPYRNWLHVEDTVSGIMTVIRSGEDNEIYNIAGGYEQKNIDTIRKIIKEFDENIKEDEVISFDEDRVGQDTRYAVNDDKLRNLGWAPQKNFDEELPKIVKSFKENFRW